MIKSESKAISALQKNRNGGLRTMNFTKFFQIFLLSIIGISLVGCVYQPPIVRHRINTTEQNIGFNGSFNGQPVMVTNSNPPTYVADRNGVIVGEMVGNRVVLNRRGRDQAVRDQMDWYKLGMGQQKQNDRVADEERDDYIKLGKYLYKEWKKNSR